jgi:hypothetical protein
MGPTLKQIAETRKASLISNHAKQTSLIIAVQIERVKLRPAKRREVLRLLKQRMQQAVQESRNATSPTRKELFMEDFRAYAKAIEQIQALK